MKLDVFFTPAMVARPTDLRQKTVVVIDALRATSTIVAALMSGAREVVPTATPEEALQLAQRLGPERTVLCGERNSVKIRGFELGNSPAEYTPAVVGGKTLVLTTTNGTAALIAARSAAKLVCGAMLNAQMLANELCDSATEEVSFLCAGTHGRFSIEDTLVAGAVIDAIEATGTTVQHTDGSRVALAIYRMHANDITAAFRDGDHGRSLVELGMNEDIEFCAQKNIDEAVLPVFDGSVIRILRKEGRTAAARSENTPTM